VVEVKDSEGKVIAYDLTISVTAGGEEIKQHLTDLQNVYGTVACLRDEAKYREDMAKLVLDEVVDAVEEKAAKSVSPLSKGAARKVAKMRIKVTITDGLELTLREARVKFAKAKKEANEAVSRMNHLDKALGTAQSLLAWERVQYRNE